MMAEGGIEMTVNASDLQAVADGVQITIGNPFNPVDTSPDIEPVAKKARILCDADPNQMSLKQLLFNINKAICLRLDGLETKVDTILNRTKTLEEKVEWLCTQSSVDLENSPTSVAANVLQQQQQQQNSLATVKRQGPVVVGVPSKTTLSPTTSTLQDQFGSYEPEKYAVIGPGATETQVLQKMYPENVTGMNQNITLITLNSEEDYPNGTWLGDESNPEMRVRVPVTPSDLLHVHSNCRTAEKMALTLLDYLFDRETQACSNLSGLGKHGKKQLDPLLIYGIRCHLISRFNVTEQDWHRIKQNIDSKCRTAFRRKQRGLPLTVKAFRGKAPTTTTLFGYPQGLQGMHDLSSHSDDDSVHHEEGELRISQPDQIDEAGNVVMTPIAHIAQHATGEIQVLHATPEQVAQLQQTHQIQILQGDQIIGHLGRNNLSNDIQVTVSLPSGENGLQIVGDGEQHPALMTEDVDHIIKADPEEAVV